MNKHAANNRIAIFFMCILHCIPMQLTIKNNIIFNVYTTLHPNVLRLEIGLLSGIFAHICIIYKKLLESKSRNEFSFTKTSISCEGCSSAILQKKNYSSSQHFSVLFFLAKELRVCDGWGGVTMRYNDSQTTNMHKV